MKIKIRFRNEKSGEKSFYFKIPKVKELTTCCMMVLEVVDVKNFHSYYFNNDDVRIVKVELIYFFGLYKKTVYCNPFAASQREAKNIFVFLYNSKKVGTKHD